jgi:predicted Holliday junction resolvase-like endonuclease
MGVIVLLILAVGWLLLRQYRQKMQVQLDRARQDQVMTAMELKVHELAAQKFDEFRVNVLQAEQDRIIAEQRVVAEASFERWKMEYETTIRQDAIKKSQAVTIGKVTEHMIPFFSGVFPYNPKEARFIGSPIDLLIFDGMETDLDNVSVHFIEVKTASSSLTPKQRAIKYAILNKRVEWKEIRV